MAEKEMWLEIKEFPDYRISNYGRVLNIYTDHIKIPTANQQGIPSVLLMRDRAQYRRAVARLVAEAFLPPHQLPAFDTPINLDGDRSNNHVGNLLWRPRWFAVKYHAQLKVSPGYGDSMGPIQDIDTGVVYANVRDAVTQCGLLERHVVVATLNGSGVFPTGQKFRFTVW
jgi:hypothetical protein